jgi:hypothetical protein
MAQSGHPPTLFLRRADPCGGNRATLIVVETLGSKQVYANAWMAVREDMIRRSDGYQPSVSS